jgi:hypothetical protein
MDNKKDEIKNEALIREFAKSSKELKTPEGLRASNRLQLTLQFINLTTYFKTSKPTVSDKTDSIGLLEKPLQPHYSEQNVYVAGMGFVEKSKNYAYFKESNYESN